MMQHLHAAAAVVQAAHSQLQAHPPPVQLMQGLGTIAPLQGVRVSEASQRQHRLSPQQHPQQTLNQPQPQPKLPGDLATSVSPTATLQESDSHSQSASAAAPTSVSEPILIPLMSRVASVIEYLKTHLVSSEMHVNSPIATAVARLENAMVKRSPMFMIQCV
jgi:hypothetical protein